VRKEGKDFLFEKLRGTDLRISARETQQAIVPGSATRPEATGSCALPGKKRERPHLRAHVPEEDILL
jgi:hypothetical protein